MASQKTSNGFEGLLPCCFLWVKAMSGKLPAMAVELATATKRLARDDPRRVVHSLKVGLAITLVSLFYYFRPLYDGFGASTMWALISVIVVFEFSVGGTLGRGLNRVMATLAAGALGFGAHYLANLVGEKGRPIVLGFFVFIPAAISTFIRFFPKMKARYDYGMLIFILTFCMVSVSGYRDDEIVKLARDRVLTILIGCSFTLFVCIFVRPVWAGSDLHHLVATNIDSLATFLQGFGDQYFGLLGQGQASHGDIQMYRLILNSKSNEESLTNLARWEPRHWKFRYRHPWRQYLEIGNLNRDCAYRLEVLNGYLKTNLIQIPLSQIQDQFQDECLKICSESGRSLRELSLAMKKMDPPLTVKPHMERAKVAADNLKSHLEEWRFEDSNAIEVVRVASLVSLLIDSIWCVEKIGDSVQKLASAGGFKAVEGQSCVVVAPEDQLQDLAKDHGAILLAHHVITIDEQECTPC
ncbi:aluminum-activated malate transporter 2-like [Momordica charantia]|uniref:Aluminum-activated malate transporter 2-like n=1 Tax=Momordica charantia TaxID=3673 RepID=A0A6J1DGC6_MOMCH|nr:aluminum-activated malate transporter 2-like [Momordica charantia]